MNGDSFGTVPVGSNAFELIEFTLTRTQPDHPLMENRDQESVLVVEPTLFGVNVAKVREVIKMPPLEPSLSRKNAVLGVFQLRGLPIPVIHLAAALGYSREPISTQAQVLITEFSGRLTGFAVASARRIRRVSWEQIIPPQDNVMDGITGMMLDESNRFIFIIDFEKILAEAEAASVSPVLAPVHPVSVPMKAAMESSLAAEEQPTIIVVDDSSTARRALSEILRHFTSPVVECKDGEHAWVMCQQLAQKNRKFMVISDIEMPRLDGYSLVRRMRSEPRFVNVPFLMHSSLSGESNKELALKAGADAFVGKLNRSEIVAAVETCLSALSASVSVEKIAS